MCAWGVESTDGELLRAFAEQRDETAFGELVKRHGGMVLAVCRNLLRNGHESEDAAQAAFLALARKAAGLTGNTSVAAWLHHVAKCVCVNICQANAARLARERKAVEMSVDDRGYEPERADLMFALSTEMEALPVRYREPLILFHGEGRSLEQTARALGCPPKTAGTRLSRGREMLRKRFMRRGMVMSSTAMGSLLSAESGAAVLPEAFLNATVKAAGMFAAVRAGSGAAGSANAVLLAKGVMRTMFIAKMKVGMIAAVGVAIVGAGIVTTAQYATGKGEAKRTESEMASAEGTNTLSARESLSLALDWLATNQSANGCWSADEIQLAKTQQTPVAGDRNQRGVTGLAVLALIRGGRAVGTHQYDAGVSRGLAWIAQQQDAGTGLISSNLYEQAICTLALSEGYESSRSGVINDAALKAVRACAAAEAKSGGWRYVPGTAQGDVCMSSWHLQALFAARRAGMPVDTNVVSRAMSFLDTCTDRRAKDGSSGAVGYLPADSAVVGSFPSLTCAGIVIRCLNGMDPKSPLLLNAAGLTMKSLPKWTEKDFYFWYYGTHAMSMVGGEYWTEWNREMSKTLLKSQFTVGERAGSWDAIGDKYNRSQAYCTAMGALCLEVVMRRTAK